MRSHLDGARIANALVSLGCTPAEMTWKAGVDMLSLGASKNGAMAAEAIVVFEPEALSDRFGTDKIWELELRRKRGAHLFSKHRYLSAQMLGYLGNDLWLQNARTANARSAMLAEGLRKAGAEFRHAPQANLIFAALPRATHQRLYAAGAAYHLWDGPLEGPGDELVTARFVCDWSVSEDQIQAFLALL